ncbi:NAD(P)/FAD-dependent oxidoreductase [Streptomyces sp. NA04227]|uniref:FAD-dependent oxidoreductase n=1 Tax=Streptomyces sp. NA04227 TaxID=2742136 RepID=UPI001591D1D4|nr:FAD-dependent oxidoreductase [Streptomyces sp. NA04227]QKW08194.1 NAD(P)/FAD-dependent oxidoreductase [Streptomyces sp. NA04227]
MSRTVVVGDGSAAHHLAERLHHHGHPGPVTLLSTGAGGPACHVALLPSVLDGTLPPEAAALPALPADVVRGTGVVTGIDRERRLVHTGDGQAYAYDRLVLATGAAAHIPDVLGVRTADGALTEGAITLDRPADWARAAARSGPVAVIGGSARGVESALALRRAGREVTLVHEAAHPLDGALDTVAGGLLAARLEREGIELLPGRRAVSWSHGKLVLDDCSAVAAESLLLCTGTVPRTALARTAGLPVRTGVLVDEGLRTADPFVYAVGGCAELRADDQGEARAGDQSEARAGDQREARADERADVGGQLAGVGRPGLAAGRATTSPAGTGDDAAALRQAEVLAKWFAHGPGPANPGPANPGFPGPSNRGPATPARPDSASSGPSSTSHVTYLPGTRPLLRLSAPGLDVLSFGTLAGAAPLVTLSDPDGERHGALALRDGRLAGAVLYGLPRGAAAVAHLHDSGAPVPADHLALLLGVPALSGAGGELPDDALVCHCNNVTRAALRGAWRDGARDFPALTARTRATTGCGSCADDVRRLCADLAAAPPPGSVSTSGPSSQDSAQDSASGPSSPEPASRPPLTEDAA